MLESERRRLREPSDKDVIKQERERAERAEARAEQAWRDLEGWEAEDNETLSALGESLEAYKTEPCSGCKHPRDAHTGAGTRGPVACRHCDCEQFSTRAGIIYGTDPIVDPADAKEVIAEASHLFGRKLVAYMTGLKRTRSIRLWEAGTPPDELSVMERSEGIRRLRFAIEAAKLLMERGDSLSTMQVWFQGMNDYLGDRAPARVLREEAPEQWGQVVSAAKAFLAQ